MIALISPAKSLDYARPLPPLEPSAPRFAAEAGTLAAAAAKLLKGPRARDLAVAAGIDPDLVPAAALAAPEEEPPAPAEESAP
jgi:hypothetical protein